MRRYQADFQVWGTCYVRANSETEAREKIETYVGKNGHVELNEDHWLDMDGDDRISAAMTPTGEIGVMHETGPWFGDDDYPEDEEVSAEPPSGVAVALAAP